MPPARRTCGISPRPGSRRRGSCPPRYGADGSALVAGHAAAAEQATVYTVEIPVANGELVAENNERLQAFCRKVDATPAESHSEAGLTRAPGASVTPAELSLSLRKIKDLRYGACVDEDWCGCEDPDEFLRDRCTEVPFLPDAHYYFIAATVVGSVIVVGGTAYARTAELPRIESRQLGAVM